MEIGKSAFSDCEKLSHLVIEDNSNFTELPDKCFYNCPIRNFTLPLFIKKIGNGCFTAADIKMNNGLEIIGNHALNGTLDKIELPETVKEIGDRAFAAPEHQGPNGYFVTYKIPKRLYINCKTPPYCKAITSLGPNVYDFATKTAQPEKCW
jgi:hypothetical protein